MEKSITNFYKIQNFYNWMEESKKAKIIKLKLSPQQLFELQAHKSNKNWKFHNALYEGFTNLIDNFIKASDEFKTQYMNGDFRRSKWECYPRDDHESYWLYKAMKLYWLYESIKNDCQHAPIQMHKFRDGHRFHPGSDKVGSLYLMGKLNNLQTNVFYIWYYKLDPDFDNLSIPYEVVKTPEEFRDMFVKFNDHTFNIISGRTIINPHYDYKKSDDHLDVSSYYASESLLYNRHDQTDLPYRINHISYNDNIHHAGIDAYLDMIMKFEHTDTTFTLPNGIKFIKKETGSSIYPYLWVPECDGNENL